MSQNLTLSTTISPAQVLALGVLVSGESITKASKEAGVAREAVWRWATTRDFVVRRIVCVFRW
jgi:hypothetical protein